MKNIKFLLLGVIILVAIILRFYMLGNIPPSPDWDEVSLGYNAYSLSLTGKDEFGKTLPVILESYGDFKPALYVYLAIPSVFIFDLNAFAVRFPSAFFGVISVILTFFLVEELFRGKKYSSEIALVSSFLLAISPWSIQFSRVAFEANIGVTFNLLAVLFFLKGLRKPWLLSLSTAFAALGIYSYQSERVFIPLLFIILVCIYFKDLKKIALKYLLAAVVIGLFVMLPMVIFTLGNPNSLQRAKATSIFGNQTQILKNNVSDIARDHSNGDLVGLALDNRRLVYVKQIAEGYLSHFDPNWLFITGDIARHHAPGMGLLYLVELPFLLAGIYLLLFGDYGRKSKLLIFLWFLAVPIPAAITNDVPHAVRTINFLPIFQIFTAIGLVYAFVYVSKIHLKLLKYLIFILAGFAFAFNFLYFINQYFGQLNYFDASEWQYGYEKAVEKSQNLAPNYDQIIVQDARPLDNSYMFFLFYTKFPPSVYQRLGNQNGITHKFGKYVFKQINWEEDLKNKKTLFISSPNNTPSNISPADVINNPDGTPAINIYKTK